MANIKVRLKKTDGEWLELGKRYISDLSSLSQSTTDPNSIQYGVIANSGSIEILDLDNSLANYIKSGLIDENLPLEILYNGKLLQSHIVTNCNYSNIDKKLKLSLSNDIISLNNSFDGMDLTVGKLSIKSILRQLFIDAGVSVDNVVIDNSSYLESMSTQYSYLESGTFNDALNKICNVGKLKIYKNDENMFVVTNGEVYHRSQSSLGKTLLIPKRMQISQLQSDLFKGNRINKIKYTYNDTDYAYTQVVNKSICIYEDPVITGSVRFDEDLFSQVSTTFSDYVDRHKANPSDIQWVAFNAPAQNNENIKYSCVKISIQKPDIKSSFDTFRFSMTGNGVYGLATTSQDSRRVVSYSNNQGSFVYNTYIGNSEENIYDTFFNRNNLGDIVSVKEELPLYSLGVVVQHKTIDFYICWNNVSLEEDQTTVRSIDYCNCAITIYTKSISCEETTFEVGNGDKEFSPDKNELFNQYLSFGGQSYYEYFAPQMLNTYKNGFSSGNIDVFIGDIYNFESGEIVKNSEIGQLLEVEDIICLDGYYGDDGELRKWKVVSREFKYSGSPFLTLQLQEYMGFS